MLVTVLQMNSTWYATSVGIPIPMPALDEDTIVPIQAAMRKIATQTRGSEWATELNAIEVAGYLAALEKSLKQGLTVDQGFELWAAQHFIGEMLKHDQIPTRKGALDWERLGLMVRQNIKALREKYDGAASL